MSLKYILRFCFFLDCDVWTISALCLCVCVLFSSFYDVLAFLLKMGFQLVVCKSEWEPERCTQILRHGICCNFLTFIDNVWCEYGSRSCAIFTLRAIQWFFSTSHFLSLVRSFVHLLIRFSKLTHTNNETEIDAILFIRYWFRLFFTCKRNLLRYFIRCLLQDCFFNAFWHILCCCSIANFFCKP